jgi:hypothetical protein
MHRKRIEPRREERQAWTECFLLCDYARAEHGKLYIVGGGWDQIVPHRLPLEYKAYLGIKLVIRWDQIVAPALIRVELLDQDENVLGEPVYEARLEDFDGDAPAELAGLTPYLTLFMGSEVNMALAAPGSFTLKLRVNELEVASLRFMVVPPREPRQEGEEAL